MAIHDWSRVFDGAFHDFHHVWIGELLEMRSTVGSCRQTTMQWPSRSWVLLCPTFSRSRVPNESKTASPASRSPDAHRCSDRPTASASLREY